MNYVVRLMHGKVFKSHFESIRRWLKIQNQVRSSIPLILRVFFEFSNLYKIPKIIFFGQNFFLADVFQYGEYFSRGFEKIQKIFFRSIISTTTCKNGSKIEVSRIFSKPR